MIFYQYVYIVVFFLFFMHLLIDIRSSHPSDFSAYYYAKIWVNFWISLHPHDTISWLLYEDQDISEVNSFPIAKDNPWFSKKKLASHSYGPDRIISFSQEKMIDPSVKTILHIPDITEFLYPRSIQNWFTRKKREKEYKDILSKSHKIIVPHFDIGRELAEVFQVSEEKIYVIPYLTDTQQRKNDHSIRSLYSLTGEYFFTEGTPGEEWNPLGILTQYSQYIHEFHGEKKLVISGNLWENLWHIASYIRSFDLIDMVKIVGLLPLKEKEIILSHASAWISIGSYYGWGTTIIEAEVFDIPLILSDIPVLREYRSIRIHPNHLEELPNILQNIHKNILNKNTKDNTAIMGVYTTLIAE